jgi:hypothetical protein
MSATFVVGEVAGWRILPIISVHRYNGAGWILEIVLSSMGAGGYGVHTSLHELKTLHSILLTLLPHEHLHPQSR